MERKKLKHRIESYQANELVEIKHALEIINNSDEVLLTNDEIGDIWHRITQAIDIKFSDDENHDAWALEAELKEAYQYK